MRLVGLVSHESVNVENLSMPKKHLNQSIYQIRPMDMIKIKLNVFIIFLATNNEGNGLS